MHEFDPTDHGLGDDPDPAAEHYDVEECPDVDFDFGDLDGSDDSDERAYTDGAHWADRRLEDTEPNPMMAAGAPDDTPNPSNHEIRDNPVPAGEDPFDAYKAAQSAEGFEGYLEHVCGYANGDEREMALYDERLPATVASAILGEAGYEVDELAVPEQRLSDTQESQAIEKFEGMDDDLAAVTALVVFGETAGSAVAFERAFQRYGTIPPTKDEFDALWANPSEGTGNSLGEYLRVGRLGRDICRGLARSGLFEKASLALRVTAANHNEQMAMNAIAYTLKDTDYPDTMRWCMGEFVGMVQEYPRCNIGYASDVLTGACSRLVEYGATDDDEALMRRAILVAETHYRE
jgi:hypothetical protein